MTIWLDMNDVLVDLDGHYTKLFGEPSWAKHKRIREDGEAKVLSKTEAYALADRNFAQDVMSIPDFWYDIPLMPYAKELVGICTSMTQDVRVLTAVLSYDKDRMMCQKRKAIIDNFPELYKIVFANTILSPELQTHSSDKANWCRSNKDVLIDNSESNIEKWKEKGGSGIWLSSQIQKEDSGFLADVSWAIATVKTNPKIVKEKNNVNN